MGLINLLFVFSFIVFASTLIGNIIIRYSKKQLPNILGPLFGLAILIILMSWGFLFGINIAVLLVVICLLILYETIHIIRDSDNIKHIVINIAFSILFIFLVSVPYLTKFGFNTYITGYYISNDIVIHAMLARDISKNANIKDKFNETVLINTELGNLKYPYPKAIHSLINFVAVLSGIETSKLVIPVSIFTFSYIGFIIIYYLAQSGKREDKNPRNWHEYITVFLMLSTCLITYYMAAILFHGFIAQTAYLPFLMLFPVIFFTLKQSFLKNILLGLLISIIVSIYGIVALIPIIFLIFICIILNKSTITPKDLLIVITLSLLLMGPNLILVINTSYVLIKSILSPASGVKNIGNLIGFINFESMTGIWTQKDYRIVGVAHTYIEAIFGLVRFIYIAIFGIGFFIMSSHKMFKNNISIISLIIMAFCTYLLSLVLIQNPYDSSKYLSLFPVLFIIFVYYGIKAITSKAIVRIILCGILLLLSMISTYTLFTNISTLSFASLNNLKRINEYIVDKSVIFYTDNDWALYYNDRTDVYISDLHYLPDNGDVITNPDVVIFDKNNIQKMISYSCNKVMDVGEFSLCFL